MPCKVIYELHSEYNSLLQMGEERSKQIELEKQEDE